MKIKLQLFFLFISIGFFIIILFNILFYHSTKGTILNQVYHHLESVSELKKERIKRIITNNHERIRLVGNPGLNLRVQAFLNDSTSIVKHELTRSLNHAIEGIKTFKSIHLCDLKGSVFATTDSSISTTSFSNIEGFQMALEGKECLDGVHLTPNNTLGLYLTSPVVLNEEVIAILIIDSNGENFVEAIQDYTGLGETGETTLSKRLPNGEAIFITPLRFDSNAALRRKVNPLNPSYFALSKKEGLYENVPDYRNQNVMAVTRYIPETGWGIVTKIDTEEALKPIILTRKVIWGISIFTGIMLFIITWAFGNYLTKPINSLIAYAHRLKSGNYSERLGNVPKNEIGVLGNAFNELAIKLDTSRNEIDKTLGQLKQSNDALNNFAYTITHDLKSPLATLEGLITILQIDENKEKDLSYSHILRLISEKVKYMSEMITKVLEYAKAGSSENMEKAQIDTNEIIKEVLSMIHPPENFQFRIQSNLPMVVYSKIPLLQVFQNIIANAIKYMDKKEGIISIGYQERPTYWEFYISDNGQGIEEKDFNRIFLMLKKITKGTIESTGIGLSTVKKIINENGGQIWVHSKVGEGSVFYFTIPKR